MLQVATHTVKARFDNRFKNEPWRANTIAGEVKASTWSFLVMAVRRILQERCQVPATQIHITSVEA